MLKSLLIKNVALIEEIEIFFESGLNIITGETGAGKSILLGSLGLLLGERASSDLVRQNTRKAVVEGTFTAADNEAARRLLSDADYESTDEIIVRREITSRGTSRAFINDSPAPLTLLKSLGDLLVDLHGQHEHQQLLRAETHLYLLDEAGGLDRLVHEFATGYNEILRTERELRELREREEQLHDKQEFYAFQLREIVEVNPVLDEDVALQQELTILENSERIHDLTGTLHGLLYADGASARDQLLKGRNLLDQLASIDPGFAEQRNECLSAISIVEEISRYVQSYGPSNDTAYERLELIRERLGALNGIRKKFGGTLEGVIAYREKIESEIALAENFDTQIALIEERLADRKIAAGDVARRLSKKRIEVSRKVQKSVEEVLRTLGIENGKFVVVLEQQPCDIGATGSVTVNGDGYHASKRGIDQAEFYISTNLGEEIKPLTRVASGGEISRIMLALKTILAKNDKLPLLVFDEIDAGISGRIASKVGSTMRELAAYHQLIAITHLPQIAAMSHNHYKVQKHEVGGRTVTEVRRLAPDEHEREVARLVSGENLTESSLKTARELIAR